MCFSPKIHVALTFLLCIFFSLLKAALTQQHYKPRQISEVGFQNRLQAHVYEQKLIVILLPECILPSPLCSLA